MLAAQATKPCPVKDELHSEKRMQELIEGGTKVLTWSHRAQMLSMSSSLTSVPMLTTAASLSCDSTSSSRLMPEKSTSTAFSLVPIILICGQANTVIE